METVPDGLVAELEHDRRDPRQVSGDDENTTETLGCAHLNEFPDRNARLAEMASQAERY